MPFLCCCLEHRNSQTTEAQGIIRHDYITLPGLPNYPYLYIFSVISSSLQGLCYIVSSEKEAQLHSRKYMLDVYAS